MILAGLARIGSDPELKKLPTGDIVLEMSLAYDYGKRDADGKRSTQWIKASFWGSRAEKIAPYLKKGKQVFVDCSEVHVNLYEKKDGSGMKADIRCKISSLEFVAGSGKDDDSKIPF
jgi:single-strand DNA-binding protein